MGKITNLDSILKEEKKLRFRGYTISIKDKYMTNTEIVELINEILLAQEKYSICINPRQHCLGDDKYLLSVDLNKEGQGTFIKLFLANNPKYKLYRRMKTYKELAQ